MAYGNIDYNGERYYLSLTMFSPNEQKSFSNIKPEDCSSLNPDSVEDLQIVHDLTNPILTGSLKYTDNELDTVGKYINEPYTYILICFAKQKEDKDSENIILDQEHKFTHLFLVNKSNIISKEKNKVIYSFDLISEKWWNFNCNIQYSTKGQTKPLSTIFNDLFSLVGLKFQTNGKATSSSIIYLASANDSLATAYNYLSSKLYTPEALLDGLNFIIYDHKNDIYELFKMSDNEPFKKYNGNSFVDALYINNTNTFINELVSDSSTKISLANHKSMTDNTRSLFEYNKWIYDYNTNEFKKINVKTKQTIDNFMLGWSGYTPKYFDFNNISSKAISKSTSPMLFRLEECKWFNHINQYNNIIGNFINNNIVIVNTTGDLRRKPGNPTTLEIDSSDKSSLSSLGGSWINLRTRHIISSKSYRNNIMLGRIYK